MKTISIDFGGNHTYYRFNEEHIVCVHEESENLIYVYIMDNNQNILNYIWCENTSMTEIEKIASEMLYELGYNGEKMDYNPYEGQAYYYLPDSNDLKFPMVIRYFSESTLGCSILEKETINNPEEYIKAMKRHQENRDTLKSIGSINFENIAGDIYRINEYVEGAADQLQYLSNAIDELFYKSDQGFRKDFIDQLNEAYELNKYLMEKVCELECKLPEYLHLVYPNNKNA